MNPEEALKIIDGIEEVRGNLPEDGLLVEEALIDVKDALKKQVPKEPIMIVDLNEYRNPCEKCKFRDGPICTNDDVRRLGYGATKSCGLYRRRHRTKKGNGNERY